MKSPWETSPMGPFDHWPTGGNGFEYFYGFVGGETNMYYPTIYEGTTPIEADKTPEQGYHFTDDMTDKAIKWVGQQKALMPDKPFFIYYAPGACHAPLQVGPEWSDKYKGKFDQGWDVLREEIFTRQKQLGVIPSDCQLTDRPSQLPSWEEMPTELKPILARQMEIYAGFLEHTDHHVGRLVDRLENMGVLDDTLIYVLYSDNGASAEGSINGAFNEIAPLSGFPGLETVESLTERLHLFGGPESYIHYSSGWAHATDTPYQWTKQIASHWGGTRVATVVHWPNGIQAKGEIRNQFHHVIDMTPTFLEVAGLPAPAFVNGTQQRPIEGVSMAYSFNAANAAERRETQYFELSGNRGIYHKGWTAITRHRIPWETGFVALPAFDDDVWELYDTNSDWSQANDLATEHPDKLRELQRLFLIEATKYNVLPLDDRLAERANSELAGRPQLITGNRQVLFGGMERLSENSVINTKNKSHAITAEVVVPESGAEGVIVAQGGVEGGWSLYARDSRLKYCYNFFSFERSTIEGSIPISPGIHQVRIEFAYDGGGLAKGGTVTLYVDDQKAGEGRVDRTMPLVFTLTETLDIGLDRGSPVINDYPTPRGTANKFSGKVNWVQIDIDKDAKDVDRLISSDELLKVALARQ